MSLRSYRYIQRIPTVEWYWQRAKCTIVVHVFSTLLSADKTYLAGWKCALLLKFKMAIIANREIINK